MEEVEALADHVLKPEEIGAGPASGSFRTAGMVIVPCSMKTIAGHPQRLCGKPSSSCSRCDDQRTATAGTCSKRGTTQPDSSPESAGTFDDAGRSDHSADDDFLSLSGEY